LGEEQGGRTRSGASGRTTIISCYRDRRLIAPHHIVESNRIKSKVFSAGENSDSNEKSSAIPQKKHFAFPKILKQIFSKTNFPG
jgi:hypothetical protein